MIFDFRSDLCEITKLQISTPIYFHFLQRSSEKNICIISLKGSLVAADWGQMRIIHHKGSWCREMRYVFRSFKLDPYYWIAQKNHALRFLNILKTLGIFTKNDSLQKYPPSRLMLLMCNWWSPMCDCQCNSWSPQKKVEQPSLENRANMRSRGKQQHRTMQVNDWVVLHMHPMILKMKIKNCGSD